jgi:membrane protease YdiL (CAAX protease family)
MTPSREDQSSWDFADLGLFLGAILPSFLVGWMLTWIGRTVAPATFANNAVRALVLQISIYAVLLGTLYVLVSVRHGQPLWRSLNWTLHFRGAWICLGVAPLLAIGISSLGAVLHAPAINPVENLISGRVSLVIVGLLVTILGPLFEELFFRGFLFAVLRRPLGAWPAIVLAAAPFALLHGPEYQWSWKLVVLIFLAGAAFGYARHKTGSTTASVLLHAGYNMTPFIGYLIVRSLR